MTIKNLSKFSILFLFVYLFFPENVSAQTLNCKFSSIASDTCQIQFGATCDPGKHPERNCPLDCSYEGPIECVSDSIPTAPPTPQPMDCFNAGGSCQPNDPSLCNGDLTVSAQCNPQKDSTGSSYRCCKLPTDTPPKPAPLPIPKPSDPTTEAYPKVGFPCDDTDNPEFHSLRPYQGASCGDAEKALFCSNELRFIESFDVAEKPGTDCVKERRTRDFTCHPKLKVEPHDLYVELTNSMFPILGNTEQVTNSQGGTEEFDDAQKVNEYASWYLSGVNNKAEYGENTDSKVVNFSGPVQKLLPKMIQEAERVKTIEKATADTVAYVDEETLETVTEPQNHDQIVVCGKEDNFGLIGDLLGIGKTNAVPCYEGSEYRLSKWLDDLSDFNGLFNRIGTDIWNKRTPPLPWDDGTAGPDEEKVPFESQEKYVKAYNEWKGSACAIIPLVDITLCIENPFVPNKWAELYQYIPLASTADKRGVERILDVQFQNSNGTVISGEDYDFKNQKNAPLSFAHTQEVKELSDLLNTTYLPEGYESEKLSETTERLLPNPMSGSASSCSAVNVRTNKGDNLFPGDRAVKDTQEMIIPGIEYFIEEASCKEVFKPGSATGCGKDDKFPCRPSDTLVCNAEVIIVVKTDVKVPNANEIFATTVADSGSTFRKIFPKVEEGAPVSCIADIPTVTGVTYNADESQNPTDGTIEFGVKNYPEDGGGSGSELTFPHIGSVYEYFLKGIQTALRPKGYGEPIANGNCKNNIKCGEIPELPKAKGSCNLGAISPRIGEIPQNLKDIVSAASETYKVPPNLILGALFGEGVFNRSDKTEQFSKYDWTEENVTSWASCTPLPNCNGPETSLILFYPKNWDEISKAIAPDLKKLDPNKVNPDSCNLIDAMYAVAWDLRRNGFGAPNFAGHSCFGIPLNSGKSTNMNGCSWDDRDIETAIRWWEFGTNYNDTYKCATKENSCATGGGVNANCATGDDCETINFRYSNPSHNACVFDVAHGN